jgi:hypothetical protein
MIERHLMMVKEIRRAAEDDLEDLTAWEDEFVDSVSKRLEAGRPLSDRQAEVLERLWEKRR